MSKKILFLSFLMGFALLGKPALAAPTTTRFVPDDTFYDHEWYMEAIRAPQAWTMLRAAPTPTREVLVAVVDGGADYSHPDLKGALWTNPDEKENGLDDDDDGYVDDIHGWNFVTDSADIRPVQSYMYLNGSFEHGTAVASLIAARGNDGIGIAGVAWKTKLMPLVILGADGAGGTDRLAMAIRYAVAHRADIINLSLEGEGDDPEVDLAIREATAKGVLVVVAAGNGYAGLGFDLGQQPTYPTCSPGAGDQGVLVVASTNDDDLRNASTNYGKCVNISAPGNDITAARPTFDENGNIKEVSGYGVWSGTSMAAPLVSGAAALLKAAHPDWLAPQLSKRLLETARPFVTATAGEGMGHGILDVSAALDEAKPEKYGPWKLLASNPGHEPMVWITDLKGRVLYSIPAGNPTDRRGLRAVFVRWFGSDTPSVLVTTQGDETGAWRIYRADGVLLSAGQASQNPSDKISGGLLLAAQDLDAIGKEQVLLTEAAGPRIWRLHEDKGLQPSFLTTEDAKPLGTLAVGLERPSQAGVLLIRGLSESSLTILKGIGVGESATATTTRPQNLDMAEGRTKDGRHVIRIVQGGEPTYLFERNGIMDVTKENIQVDLWRQAPLGMAVTGQADRRFYDFWPR